MDQTVFSNNKTIEQIVGIVSILYSKRQRHYPEYSFDNIRDQVINLCDHSFTKQFITGENGNLEQYMEYLFQYILQRYNKLIEGHEDTEWCFGCIDEVLDEDGIYFHILYQQGYPEDWLLLVKGIITSICIQFMTIESKNQCIVNTLNNLQLIKKHLFK